MKRGSTKGLIAAGLAGALLLVGNATLMLRNAQQMRDDARWVSHTHEVMARIENIFSMTKDAESGQRGYLVTGEQRYLEPYRNAVANIRRRIADGKQLTADNARQQEYFRALEIGIDSRLATLEEGIALRNRHGFDVARNYLLEGKGFREMERVRAQVGKMLDEERALLERRAQASAQSYEVLLWTAVVSALLGIGVLAMFLLFLNRYLASREAATAEVFAQRELLRVTVASIGDAVITTDHEARVTYLNPLAEALTGWTTADAQGQPLPDVFCIVNETTRAMVDNPALRALREGVIVGLANHTVLIARDGSERAIDDSAAPIRDAAGKVIGCVLVFRDVSERRQAEDALKSNEARFRELAEAIPQIIWSAGPDGRAGYFNERWYRYSGAPAGSVDTGDWERSLHPDDLRTWRAAYEAALAAQSPLQVECRLRSHDTGQFRWFLCRALPVRDADGTLLRWIGSCTDVDEARRLQQELQDGTRRKDEFLATLAHELRNPLAPIRNAISILDASPDKAAAYGRVRGIVDRQLSQMVRLIDDLLDISRISRGKLELRRERLDAATVLQQAVEASRPAIDAAKHAFELALPDTPLPMDADPARLAQVFANLLQNACKFTPPGGRISVSAARFGGRAVVIVRDNGAGIPAAMLPRIFEMFTQLDTASGQSGLGIGLALARSLVEMHGGTLEAQSMGLGQGSTFTVRLPLSDAPGEARETEAGAARAPAAERRRVLVVDDNRDAASSLAMLLEASNCEVRIAFDGEEAVAAAEAHRPEVVLLDLGLPKLSGYEVARLMRLSDWGRAAYIVALTGWGQETDRQRTRDAGFDHHLVKPVAYDDLMSTLSRQGGTRG